MVIIMIIYNEMMMTMMIRAWQNDNQVYGEHEPDSGNGGQDKDGVLLRK